MLLDKMSRKKHKHKKKNIDMKEGRHRNGHYQCVFTQQKRRNKHEQKDHSCFNGKTA